MSLEILSNALNFCWDTGCCLLSFNVIGNPSVRILPLSLFHLDLQRQHCIIWQAIETSPIDSCFYLQYINILCSLWYLCAFVRCAQCAFVRWRFPCYANLVLHLTNLMKFGLSFSFCLFQANPVSALRSKVCHASLIFIHLCLCRLISRSLQAWWTIYVYKHAFI